MSPRPDSAGMPCIASYSVFKEPVPLSRRGLKNKKPGDKRRAHPDTSPYRDLLEACRLSIRYPYSLPRFPGDPSDFPWGASDSSFGHCPHNHHTDSRQPRIIRTVVRFVKPRKQPFSPCVVENTGACGKARRPPLRPKWHFGVAPPPPGRRCATAGCCRASSWGCGRAYSQGRAGR